MKDARQTGTTFSRVEAALKSLRAGHGVLVTDDEDRENEADLIFAAETLTCEQMAMLIRDCSGIVCLCLTDEQLEQLALPMMVDQSASAHGTVFTVSIDAADGGTGVLAEDRVRTVRVAIAGDARPGDLARPGHVFPLRAHPARVLGRRGHTEATVDLVRLPGLGPAGVLCGTSALAFMSSHAHSQRSCNGSCCEPKSSCYPGPTWWRALEQGAEPLVSRPCERGWRPPHH